MQKFPRSKQPGESYPVIVGFGFDDDLETGETIASVDPITVTVLRGTDPNPSAILSGLPQAQGTDVAQRVIGGIDRTDYQLSITIHTSLGNTYIGDAILAVRIARP